MARVGRDREIHKRLAKGWAYGPRAKRTGVRTLYFRPTNAGDKRIVKAITGGPMSLRLGATFDEASTVFAALIVAARSRETSFVPGTVGELVNRGRREILPTIENPKTRAERARHFDELEACFGTMRYAKTVYDASRATDGSTLRSMHIQRRIDEGKKTRPVAVNRAVDSWDLLFTWAITRWGVTEFNPCAGVMKNRERGRKVLPPHDRLYRGVYRKLDPPMRFVVNMYRYYGRRKIESLQLLVSSGREDGIHLTRSKDADGKAIIIRWDPRNRKMWARVTRWRVKVAREGKRVETALLLNRRGRPLTESGANSAWRRGMARAGMKGEFTLHDVRKLRADTLSAADAQHVLAHDDARTTNRKYRVGPHVIDLNDEVRRRK